MDTDLDFPTQATHRHAHREKRKHVDAVWTRRDEPATRLEFSRMESGFAPHGGMLRSDEMIQRLREHWDQPISVLARWIVARAMITVDWRQDLLIPVFQVDVLSRCLRPGCREVIMELRDVMDDWDIARWFATGNPWLGGLAPVDMLASSWREVFDAARIARFIARG